MLAFGIDPGRKGAIVAYVYGNNEIQPLVEATMMPMRGKIPNGEEVADFFRHYQFSHAPTLAVVEKVGVMPKQGAVSGFTFGKGVGVLYGVLDVLKIPYLEITPQAWKKVVLAGTDRSKEAAIAFVERRFPHLPLIPKGARKKQDGIADAACLALYASSILR